MAGKECTCALLNDKIIKQRLSLRSGRSSFSFPPHSWVLTPDKQILMNEDTACFSTLVTPPQNQKGIGWNISDKTLTFFTGQSRFKKRREGITGHSDCQEIWRLDDPSQPSPCFCLAIRKPPPHSRSFRSTPFLIVLLSIKPHHGDCTSLNC